MCRQLDREDLMLRQLGVPVPSCQLPKFSHTDTSDEISTV